MHLTLKSAVEAAGSQTAFAEICGVSQAAVWKWLNGEKHLPAEHVLKVEAATGISRHDLRPDLYPAELSRPAHAAIDHAPSLASAEAAHPCNRRADLQLGEAIG